MVRLLPTIPRSKSTTTHSVGVSTTCPAIYGDITMSFADVPNERFGIRWEPGLPCVNPGVGCQAVVIRWTAPWTSSIRINGSYRSFVRGGGKTAVRIRKGVSVLSSGEVACFDNAAESSDDTKSSLSTAKLLPAANVMVGNIIDFMFSRGDEPYGVHVGADLCIEATGSAGVISCTPSLGRPERKTVVAAATQPVEVSK